MILADWGANGQNPAKVATSGTAAVYFPRLQFQALQNGQAGGPTGFPGLQAPVTPTATNAQGQLNLPGSQYFTAVQGQRLRVIAAGSIWTAASQTATITVQINTANSPSTGLSSPTYTTLMTTGASPAQSGRISWFLEGHLTIAGNSSLTTDTVSSGYQANFGSPAPLVQGMLSGSYFGNIDQTAVALVTMGAIPTVTLGPQPQFNPSGLVINVAFSVGTAGNNATLNEFVIVGD